MDISGYVVLGIATLFFLYLMPQLIRSRQDVVDSRVDDRFSADLRILATAGTVGSPPRPVFDDDGAPRAYLHDPRLRTEVSAMNRPPALGSRAASTTTPRTSAGTPRPTPAVTSAASQARAAARAESVRRRRAAARRRLVLTLVLLAATVGAWAGVASGLTAAAVAAIPTLLLAAVLVLGRRAAIAGQRIEQAWRQEDARASAEPAPARAAREENEVGAQHALRTGAARQDRRPQERVAADPVTELIPRIEAAPSAIGLTWHGEPTAPDVAEVDVTPAETGRTAPEAAAPEGSWTPVPVPVPTYTLKPQAPRRDAAPLVLDEPASAVTGAATESQSEERAADGGAPARALDLDAVLSRRRAAGE